METFPIFTRLDQELVYNSSVEATEIDEIQCDRSSVANLNQANTVEILLCGRFWISNE